MPSESLTVLVYSDDVTTRAAVLAALGRRPAADLPDLEYVEVATDWAVMDRLKSGGVDLVILDGEAVPAGGLGVCRTIKEEVHASPPVLVLLGRPQDGWLATWSRADATVALPIDPVATAGVVADVLRERVTSRAPATQH